MLLHRGPAHFLVFLLVCLQDSLRLEARVVMVVHQVLEVEVMAAVALVVVAVVDSLVATEVVVALVAASLHLEVVVAVASHLCLLLVAVVVVVVVLLLAEVVVVDPLLHPFQHLVLHLLVIPLIPNSSL